MCPGNHESAGKRRSGRARKGDAALRVALSEAAWAAVRSKDTYLSAPFRRFCRRFGKKGEGKAIFAVAHTLLVIVWTCSRTKTTTWSSAPTTSHVATPPRPGRRI